MNTKTILLRYTCASLFAISMASMSSLPVHAESGYGSYWAMANQIASNVGVSGNLVNAIISVESNYEPLAISGDGAVGLMQLIPKYGATEGYYSLYGAHHTPERRVLMTPAINIRLGSAYLRRLKHHYFGWIDDDEVRLRAIIAAYNWGPTATLKNIFPGRNSYVRMTSFLNRIRLHAPQETLHYLDAVLGAYNSYQRLDMSLHINNGDRDEPREE